MHRRASGCTGKGAADTITAISDDPAREHDERMIQEMLWAAAANEGMWRGMNVREDILSSPVMAPLGRVSALGGLATQDTAPPERGSPQGSMDVILRALEVLAAAEIVETGIVVTDAGLMLVAAGVAAGPTVVAPAVAIPTGTVLALSGVAIIDYGVGAGTSALGIDLPRYVDWFKPYHW